MAFAEIKDFKNGLDTRRPAVIGEPGSLVVCKNAHITRGGDVESRKSFVADVALPTGTFGLHSSGGKLYVFGSAAAPTNLPGKVIYQRLAHPASGVMTALLSVKNNDGKVYAIAEYDDGSVYHFYNGSRVTAWDTKGAALADNSMVASYLADKIDAVATLEASATGSVISVTASVPGSAFSISVAKTGTGMIATASVQANLVEVPETRASASFTVTDGFPDAGNYITEIKAGMTTIAAGPIPFVLDNSATALACVIAINQGIDTHGYFASALGAVVTILAPEGDGAAANARVLTTPAAGFLTIGSLSNFAGGVDFVAAKPQIDTVTIGGTYAFDNTYTVTVKGVDYLITGLAAGMPRVAEPFTEKMYTGIRGLEVFSAVGDPTDLSGTGYGQIKISSQEQGSQRITGFGVYQGLLAVFTREAVQVWFVDPDPLNNALRQVLPDTGTRSPRSIRGYSSTDLLYLADTGIRSIRARDQTNAAFADDIGTKIDGHVLEYVKTLSDARVEAACAAIDPEGRAWMAVGGRIYVFSYFPGSKVSAWSWYEPGFEVEWLAVAQRKTYARSGDTIYLYGGSDGETYPASGETEVVVQLPFIDARRITGDKQIRGVDLLCTGEWTINLLVDPRDETLMTNEIIVSGPTTLMQRIMENANTTHFAPLLTSSAGGRLLLSSVIVNFKDGEAT